MALLCFLNISRMFSLHLEKSNIGEHSQIHLQNTVVPRRCFNNVFFFTSQVKKKAVFTYLFGAKLLSCYFTLHSLLITGLTASYPIRLIGCIVVWAIIGSCFYRQRVSCYSVQVVLLLCYKIPIFTTLKSGIMELNVVVHLPRV